jgi:PIN domain nuclease of toxin-antitoxin system
LILLDTHALVWAMAAPAELSATARRALETSAERCVSAASLYEITYKAAIGKWPEVAPLLSIDLDARLRADGFDLIPASGAIMQRAGSFDWPHRDPFDRIIVATALTRGLAVVSKDDTLDTNGAPGWARIW